jgi:hypothetical protein
MREMCDIEKRLNDIEESFNTAIKDLREAIEEKKNNIDDFRVEGLWRIDLDNRTAVTRTTPSMDFKSLCYYNCFLDMNNAERWAKKINAQLKLRIIAEHLNEGWKLNWSNAIEEKHFIAKGAGGEIERRSNNYTDLGAVYFKTEIFVKEAIELMGDQVHDLFLEQ